MIRILESYWYIFGDRRNLQIVSTMADFNRSRITSPVLRYRESHSASVVRKIRIGIL